MAGWLDGAFARHDEGYLAEKLARAVEATDDHSAPYQVRLEGLRAALRDYRAVHPRLDA